jgi:hypothetical protein
MEHKSNLSDNELQELINLLKNNDGGNSIEIKYSFNFGQVKKYVLDDIINNINKVIFNYDDSDSESDSKSNSESDNNYHCYYCGNGEVVIYIVLLNDNNYAFMDLWSGCLTYGSRGTITISESFEDLQNMCMTNEQRNIYNKYKTKDNI